MQYVRLDQRSAGGSSHGSHDYPYFNSKTGINLDLDFERDIRPHLTLQLGEGASGDVFLGVYNV
eukprot:scaffold371551_cov33-Prasinocladus_malaysianus.AAC.1